MFKPKLFISQKGQEFSDRLVITAFWGGILPDGHAWIFAKVAKTTLCRALVMYRRILQSYNGRGIMYNRVHDFYHATHGKITG